MAKIYPVILAGGSGTRLWPLSRKNFPKQFLNLQGKGSLLQQTVQRVQKLSFEASLIVSNEAHYFLCQEQLQAVDCNPSYLLEPCARNTAPAIISAAQYIASREGQDALMIVLPSDHWIEDDQAWLEAMHQGIHAAQSRQTIVTFGIKPSEPKTGYGYIEAENQANPDAMAVIKFCEKPDKKTAEAFLASGQYYWNSGMFIAQVSTWLAEARQHAPDIYQTSAQAVSQAHKQNDFLRLDRTAFEQCRNESIDYAIMEQTTQASLIPMNIHWSDLGCWSAVAESHAPDANGNTLQGNVIAKGSENCLISSDKTLVTTLGIRDQIIIATSDAVLVADKKHSQQVKDIVNQLGKHSHMADDHVKVSRPWGHYEILAEGETFKVKRLMLKAHAKISLQMHHYRSEHWVVVCGTAQVINGEQTSLLSVNQSTYIPKNTKHRLSNPTDDPLYIIEVQNGPYLGEDDIIRFDDAYHRETEPTPSSVPIS